MRNKEIEKLIKTFGQLFVAILPSHEEIVFYDIDMSGYEYNEVFITTIDNNKINIGEYGDVCISMRLKDEQVEKFFKEVLKNTNEYKLSDKDIKDIVKAYREEEITMQQLN